MGKKGARKGMDEDEIFAAAIIGFATGTLTREFDRRGASNGSNRHDFDLLTSDGKSVVGALEVGVLVSQLLPGAKWLLGGCDFALPKALDSARERRFLRSTGEFSGS